MKNWPPCSKDFSRLLARTPSRERPRAAIPAKQAFPARSAGPPERSERPTGGLSAVGCRAANATRVFLAGVLGNRALLVTRAPRKLVTDAPRELLDVLGIQFLPPFESALATQCRASASERHSCSARVRAASSTNKPCRS